MNKKMISLKLDISELNGMKIEAPYYTYEAAIPTFKINDTWQAIIDDESQKVIFEEDVAIYLPLVAKRVPEEELDYTLEFTSYDEMKDVFDIEAPLEGNATLKITVKKGSSFSISDLDRENLSNVDDIKFAYELSHSFDHDFWHVGTQNNSLDDLLFTVDDLKEVQYFDLVKKLHIIKDEHI